MSEESMPPERSTPTGTSATIRRLTAVRNVSMSASCQMPASQPSSSDERAKAGSQ